MSNEDKMRKARAEFAEVFFDDRGVLDTNASSLGMYGWDEGVKACAAIKDAEHRAELLAIDKNLNNEISEYKKGATFWRVAYHELGGVKDAEIAELKEQAAESRMIGVEQGRHEYLNEIAALNLMIKELREALIEAQGWNWLDDDLPADVECRIDAVAAKSEHHDSRALEKMLLEAELEGTRSSTPALRALNICEKLAELNKE